jgi:hypothetical protein
VQSHSDATQTDVARRLEQEFAIIRGAIAMVASGRSDRILLASLRFADELLDAAMAAAARERSVGVRLLWSLDETGPAMVVESLEPARLREGDD